MDDQEYFMFTVEDGNYERVTQHAGVKTTISRNRFEVLCRERAEINEQTTIQELKAWFARRREEALREDGSVSGEMP